MGDVDFFLAGWSINYGGRDAEFRDARSLISQSVLRTGAGKDVHENYMETQPRRQAGQVEAMPCLLFLTDQMKDTNFRQKHAVVLLSAGPDARTVFQTLRCCLRTAGRRHVRVFCRYSAVRSRIARDGGGFELHGRIILCLSRHTCSRYKSRAWYLRSTECLVGRDTCLSYSIC